MDFDFDNLVVMDKKKEYEKIKPGLHNAICVGVWNIGPHKSEYGIKNKFMIGFEVEQRNTQTNEQMLHLDIYTMSVHKKSKFGMLYESWIGQRLKDEDRSKFNFSQCVGKKATLNIIHNEKYVNISAILPAQDGNSIKLEDVLKGEIPSFVKTMRAKAVIEDEQPSVNVDEIVAVQPKKEVKKKEPVELSETPF